MEVNKPLYKETPLEQVYAIKLIRSIKDLLTNKENPNFIDIDSEEFESIHFMVALKEIVPTEFESLIIFK